MLLHECEEAVESENTDRSSCVASERASTDGGRKSVSRFGRCPFDTLTPLSPSIRIPSSRQN